MKYRLPSTSADRSQTEATQLITQSSGSRLSTDCRQSGARLRGFITQLRIVVNDVKIDGPNFSMTACHRIQRTQVFFTL